MLSISLFATLNIQPVEAIVPNQDAVALKEYKQYASYNPSYTFSKPTSSVLEMMSTQGGNGPAYAFFHIDKSYLHGNKLRVYWRWYLDYSGPSYTLAYVYVVNNVANRKLINEGEFRTENNEEHPITDFTYTTACWRTATCNGGWINWDTYTSNILDLSAYSSTVTIMIKSIDPWIANTVGLQVDYLQILNSNNQVIKTYDFSSPVSMDRSDTYYDYGILRNPTSMLYGTTNYAFAYVPTWEEETSDSVSDAIHDLFYATGKYYYLADSWGPNTEPSTVYSTTATSERYYDFSTVFYKGHTWPAGYNCDKPGCQLNHTRIYDDEGNVFDDLIKDYEIFNTVNYTIHDVAKHATHDFLFLWTCGLANSSACWIGVFNGEHSAGFLPSWMYLNPWSLNNDGYHGAPDYSDHIFISFEGVSIWYRTPASNPNFNYAHWVYLFYYYLLTEGYTVKAALDQASRDTHNNNDFDNCPLDNWYWLPVPPNGESVPGRMRIWGDVTIRLPR
ncbi:MAG: hypothetical protein NWE95_03650 [Candidatus Bathyarchaeota archaeon]|nr:hypothetical protein [Candidatus Bathyarchaeota archaeon]